MTTTFRLWGWSMAVVAVGIILFAPAPSPRAGQSTKNDEGWVVPRLNLALDPQSLAVGLQRTNLWGGQAEVIADAEDRLLQWRVAGVTGQARERFVLVQFGDDRIMPLKAGEKFPDGTPIADVRENGVCVTLSGKRRFLPLNGQTIPIVW